MKALKSVILEELNTPTIFTIVKPGSLNLTQTIIEKFEENGYKMKKIRTKRLLPIEAKELYAIHKEEEWYEPLWKYMSSNISTAIIFSKDCEDIFKETAKLKDEIRKEFGESDMRNVLHSSDSAEHMEVEQSIYF